MSRAAEKAGANVLSVITPFFAKASQEELYRHYATIAGSVSLPIVLYNIPARTGNALSPATMVGIYQSWKAGDTAAAIKKTVSADVARGLA